jgi:ABC-type branched-subunit amino acid transport system substrate-binding protein
MGVALAGQTGTRPKVALIPKRPVSAAGARIDPPPSVPSANGVTPAATDAAAPPDEPPGDRASAHGFLVPPLSREKFEEKDVDMTPQLQRLREAGADTVILVGNAAPGAQVVKSLAGKVHFGQTYSFFGPQNDAGKRVLKALMAKYPDINGPGDVTPPVGVANAYDAMQLTALALAKAGSSEGSKLREGLLDIESYQGLIKLCKTLHRCEPRRLE